MRETSPSIPTVSFSNIYAQAVEALNKLYYSRTRKTYTALATPASEEEQIIWLKQRVYEEQIYPLLSDVLRVQLIKKGGNAHPADLLHINALDFSEAIVRTAEICLTSEAVEAQRRHMCDFEDGSAYYDINTNEKMPYGTEDLFYLINRKERRFVWDVNSSLPSNLDEKHAFIVGQTFDHESDFWLRSEVRKGNESLFAFGVKHLSYRHCLHIQRLRRNVIAAIYRVRKTIPDSASHFSADSRLEEVHVIVYKFLLGKERLLNEIYDLQPYSAGSYTISVLLARCCAALLLHEDAPKLKPKVSEEWQKLLENHPNFLGDTQLIQNALYFDAAILTRDEGAKQIARYCGIL